MRALICNRPGGADVLAVGERPMPQTDQDKDEILIKVEYTALNRADIMQRQGKYPPPPGATDVLGLECLGRIVLASPGSSTE